MRKNSLIILGCAVLLAIGLAATASAGLSPEEIAKLGTTLTPLGGEKAGNADGTATLSLSLTDFSGALFASDALPLPPGGLTLADFGWSTLQYESAAGFLQGRLDSLACNQGCNGFVPPPSPVSEPGTVPLLLAGLGACGFLLRRSRAR